MEFFETIWTFLSQITSEQWIRDFFSQYAHRPYFVYSGIVLFMTASSFGFPIPEEIVLVASGFVAFAALNMEVMPGTPVVRVEILSVVCFLAVLGSDCLIYFLGRFFGDKIIKTRFFKKNVGLARLEKINSWFQRYSSWACGIFRFTPGIRFPGHMTCGFLKVPFWKFITIDGLAALISVPTQVLLVAYYGEVILAKFREFKIIILALIVFLISFYFIKKRYLLKKQV